MMYRWKLFLLSCAANYAAKRLVHDRNGLAYEVKCACVQDWLAKTRTLTIRSSLNQKRKAPLRRREYVALQRVVTRKVEEGRVIFGLCLGGWLVQRGSG